jgi:hypothetical protein
MTRKRCETTVYVDEQNLPNTVLGGGPKIAWRPEWLLRLLYPGMKIGGAEGIVELFRQDSCSVGRNLNPDLPSV